MIPALVNHLWQSTLFAGVAGLLTLMLRKNRAGARYWLWLAASLKFLVPFATVAALASHLTWTASPVRAAPRMAAVVAQAEPFVAPARLSPPTRSPAPLFAIVWGCGFVVVIFYRARQWRRMRRVVRAAVPLPIAGPIPVKASRSLIEPGVFGVFHPVLLLPDGIRERLEPEQLRATLAHEWAHVERHDNLTATVHLFVEAIFWFYPLVWWIGARLVEERERACDEAVFSQGHDPEAYAEGILRVCRFYIESPLPYLAGVTGSDLRKRIERILAHRIGRKLHFGKKLMLAAATTSAVALPVGIGIWNAPPGFAQLSPTPAAKTKFEVASVKSNRSGELRVMVRAFGGRWTVTNMSLRNVISYAYRLKDFQLSGGPGWINSERFDITAKAEGNPKPDEYAPMVQSLLADRFQLKFHREMKQMPVYALVVSQAGKQHPVDDDCGPAPRELPPLPGPGQAPPCGSFFMLPGRLRGSKVPIGKLADALSVYTQRIVLNETGLTGKYDVDLEWTPEAPPFDAPPGAPPLPAVDPNGPPLWTALESRLGLKLEARKGPVEITVIDRIERPSEN